MATIDELLPVIRLAVKDAIDEEIKAKLDSLSQQVSGVARMMQGLHSCEQCMVMRPNRNPPPGVNHTDTRDTPENLQVNVGLDVVNMTTMVPNACAFGCANKDSHGNVKGHGTSAKNSEVPEADTDGAVRESRHAPMEGLPVTEGRRGSSKGLHAAHEGSQTNKDGSDENVNAKAQESPVDAGISAKDVHLNNGSELAAPLRRREDNQEDNGSEHEKSLLTKRIPNKPVLKYEYHPNQWSPLNPEGKKCYDRDFLLKVQFAPECVTKPTGLPQLEVVSEKPLYQKDQPKKKARTRKKSTGTVLVLEDTKPVPALSPAETQYHAAIPSLSLFGTNVQRISYNPMTLTLSNLETVKNIYDYRCYVSGGEHCFVLSLGGSNTFEWDGKADTSWIKMENIKLELPKDTFLEAEKVMELRVKKKEQKKRAALHVIDAMALGGEDISHLAFNERNEKIGAFIQAIHNPKRTDLAPFRVKEFSNFENLEKAFERLEMKFVKESGGTLKCTLCCCVNANTYFLPTGMQFVKTVKDPWMLTIGQFGFYNTMSKEFRHARDRPKESILTFVDSLNNRLSWTWGEGVEVLFPSQASQAGQTNVSKRQMLNFISQMTGRIREELYE